MKLSVKLTMSVVSTSAGFAQNAPQPNVASNG
ncbi:hypothetical protein AWB69_03496 [Caballeronia udeis]|uniref:Uncharacterized protein n=1 Tax=Caballeronia udeis TaxID=1232866 RepID=A0A158GWD5_9BURK|nr:hypothetical protein AWB69_03496 [Caballeronia udeis]